MNLTTTFLRSYLKANLRGQTRLAFALANKLESLHSVPIPFLDRPPVYVDLRGGRAHEWLKGSPWPSSPDEPEEQKMILQFIRPGAVVLDIGASIGLYTALFSRLVGPGHVYSFEPNPRLIPNLQRTVAELKNVTLYSYALSDHEGEATLFVPNDHTFGSLADYTKTLERRERIGLTDAEPVPCSTRTLDSLIPHEIPYPNLIKCDVEGAEYSVFKGAINCLDRVDAPVILFEALAECNEAFGLSRLAVVEFLSSLSKPRYQFSDLNNANILAVPMAYSQRSGYPLTSA